MKCDNCKNQMYCGINEETYASCFSAGYKAFSPISNADRIRAMTDEELARRIAARTACMDCILLEECNRRTGRRRCVDMWLDWLKSPADKEGEG